MSDFIIDLESNNKGPALLSFLKKPYGNYPPEGEEFNFSWGSMAVLRDKLSQGDNIYHKNNLVFSWIGDLATEITDEFVEEFISCITKLNMVENKKTIHLENEPLFKKLNGAFSIVVATSDWLVIVTDPVSFVPVYVSYGENGKIMAVGTYLDAVAEVSSGHKEIDIVSIGEFLDAGHITFPYTIYKNIKQASPGRIFILKKDKDQSKEQDFIYWLPPVESEDFCKEDEYTEELQDALLKAVKIRSSFSKVGIFLSGGLDSRTIAAMIPSEVNCVALTFCNQANYETKITNKLSNYYNMEWILLKRNQLSLSDFLSSVMRTGCEFEWINDQNSVFANAINDLGIDSLIGGAGFDIYLKGVRATDWYQRRHWCGLSPPRYFKKEFYNPNFLSSFSRKNFKVGIVTQVLERRMKWYYKQLDQERSSSKEFTSIYPFSNSGGCAYWTSVRRVIPLRLPVMDRRVIEFAFKCPVRFKLGGRIVQNVSRRICGKGSELPIANNGVTPASDSFERFLRRALWESQKGAMRIIEKFGFSKKIQHPYVDYDFYWKNNSDLNEIAVKYSQCLDEFGNTFLKRPISELLFNRNCSWEYGLRLFQLAIWKNKINNF